MCLFHKWTKWEQYTESGTYLLGRLQPKAVQGKEVRYTESRQKRKCSKCGKAEDIKVQSGY